MLGLSSEDTAWGSTEPYIKKVHLTPETDPHAPSLLYKQSTCAQHTKPGVLISALLHELGETTAYTPWLRGREFILVLDSQLH